MSGVVLVYDDDCSFCRWLVSKLLAWDRRGRIRPVALQDEEADRIFAGMSHERKMDSWHLAVEGRIYSAGAAVAPLTRQLPGGKALAFAADLFPGMTEWLYRLMAANRERLGKVLRLGPGSCQITRGSTDGSAQSRR